MTSTTVEYVAPARPTGRRVDELARRLAFLIGAGVLAGGIGGFLAAGVGSRLAMRIVALIAGRDQYGRLTDAGEVVGEITAGGTLFLLFFGTMLGFLGGLVYMAVRRWLPGRGWRRGLLYGGLLLTVFGSIVIDSDNIDFHLFVSSYISVILFAALFPLFGLIVAPIVDRLDDRAPRFPRNRWLVAAGWLPILAGCAVGLQADIASLRAIF
jgi:hypothetical protein